MKPTRTTTFALVVIRDSYKSAIYFRRDRVQWFSLGVGHGLNNASRPGIDLWLCVAGRRDCSGGRKATWNFRARLPRWTKRLGYKLAGY